MTTADGGLEVRADGKSVLRFERRLAHPIERVWAAVTDPDELIAWWGRAQVELEPGGRFSMAWLNVDDEGNRAEMEATITELDPPRLLELSGDIHGVLRFELAAEGDETVLTFTSILDLPGEYRTKVLAGWHFHLDALADALDGRATDLVSCPAGRRSTSATWAEAQPAANAASASRAPPTTGSPWASSRFSKSSSLLRRGVGSPQAGLGLLGIVHQPVRHEAQAAVAHHAVRHRQRRHLRDVERGLVRGDRVHLVDAHRAAGDGLPEVVGLHGVAVVELVHARARRAHGDVVALRELAAVAPVVAVGEEDVPRRAELLQLLELGVRHERVEKHPRARGGSTSSPLPRSAGARPSSARCRARSRPRERP